MASRNGLRKVQDGWGREGRTVCRLGAPLLVIKGRCPGRRNGIPRSPRAPPTTTAPVRLTGKESHRRAVSVVVGGRCGCLPPRGCPARPPTAEWPHETRGWHRPGSAGSGLTPASGIASGIAEATRATQGRGRRPVRVKSHWTDVTWSSKTHESLPHTDSCAKNYRYTLTTASCMKKN